MRAYEFHKFEEFPDIADIQNDGRKSSVGRFDEKGYNRNPESKAKTRRYLKRRDKAKAFNNFCDEY